MFNFFMHILQSFVLVGALLIKDGALAKFGDGLLSTDGGTGCCCGPLNCACCNRSIVGVIVSIAGIADGPPRESGDSTFYCEGCGSLNKNILIPYTGDCNGQVSYSDFDAGIAIPAPGFDVDCYVDDPFDDPFQLDTYERNTIIYSWSISCDFDFETGEYSLTLTVTVDGFNDDAGLYNIATFVKTVGGLTEEESKECTLLNGAVPRTFTIGSIEGDCNFAGISCTATVQEL